MLTGEYDAMGETPCHDKQVTTDPVTVVEQRSRTVGPTNRESLPERGYCRP